MLIQFIGNGSEGRFNVEANSLTLESLTNELRTRELNFTIDNSTIVNYSYKNEAGRNTGEFTDSTVISLPPTGVVTITQQMRETKARAYSAEEVQDIIAEAKEALVSQEYKALRSACRELSNVSPEVKEIIGNYTHYTVSSLVDAVERAVKFLSPEVTEVSAEDLQAIIARIAAIEAKVNRIVNETSTGNFHIEISEGLNKILTDLAFVANHFGIMLPNHTDLFEQK